MFSIGDFAKLGRVSVRMLRHYDSLGLLPPAVVDPHSGYRHYQADQLPLLNRIIVLNDLGFTLQQVKQILADKVSLQELHGMLRLRRGQLEAQITADTARLAHVEARLRVIEREGHMDHQDVIVKPVPTSRYAVVTGIAASYEATDIGPVITPLYPQLSERLAAAGVAITAAPCIAYYEDTPDGTVTVHAGLPVAIAPGEYPGFAVVDLPALEQAATAIHRGPMAEVDGTMQALAQWIEDNGYRMDGYAREVYLEYCAEQPEQGITELQIAVSAR